MADKKKMTAVEITASAIYFCLIFMGFIFGATLGTQDHSVFKPLPYALGNTYDAETLQLAEHYKVMKNTSHQVAGNTSNGKPSTM